MGMMGSRFGNDHVRIYTKGMTMWTPSFTLVHLAHDGNWKVYEPEEALKWWEDAFWVAKQRLKSRRWGYKESREI